MSKTNWKPGTLLYPLPPALVTVGTMDEPNVLTIAWTGIVCSDPPMTYISVRKERHSHPMLLKTREFVINLPTENLLKAVDYCGVRTGGKTNKFADMSLSLEPSLSVGTPGLKESPLSLECKVTNVIELGSHDMFMAEIKSVRVEESLIDEKGRLRLDKAKPVAFCHGWYYALGKGLGKFGFSVEKKKTKEKRRRLASEEKRKRRV